MPTLILDPISVNNSQLFKTKVTEDDGVTLVTPDSCVCSIWEADSNTNVVDEDDGDVGDGFAQYNWAGTATAGNYEAELKVTIDTGVVISQLFRIKVLAAPPDFTNDTESDIGLVRLELGDDIEGQGVRPDGSNLADVQIQAWLDREGSVMRAAAAACEALSRQWTVVANIQVGARREELSKVSEQWMSQAEKLRTQYGGGGSGAFSTSMRRADGYAEEAESSGLEFSLDD